MAKTKNLPKKAPAIPVTSKENKNTAIIKTKYKESLKERAIEEKLSGSETNAVSIKIPRVEPTSKQVKKAKTKQQTPIKKKQIELPVLIEAKTEKSNRKQTKVETEAEGNENTSISVLPDESVDFKNAPHFDEIIFRDTLTPSKLKGHVLVFSKLIKDASQRSIIFADYKVLLDVVYFKVPNCPKRNVKLHLAHPMYNEDDDICMIVRDVKRGLGQDHEASKEKYEGILRKAGITSIKTVLPYSQLRKEYGNFELKLRLRSTYNLFLCDGALIGPVVSFLGKKFQKSAPIPVRSNTDNIAREITNALKRTSYMQGQKGPLISIPIGTHKTTTEQLTDNIEKIIDQLKELYPGGYENIRSMHLRVNIPSTKSVPIYISLCRPPEKVPYVVGPREKLLASLEEKDLHKFQIMRSGKLMKKSQKLAIDNIKVERKQKPKNKRKLK